MKKRSKREYPFDFKTTLGFSLMGFVNVAASTFMISAFILYLTDYSKLYAGVSG
jgi:hypothetical protein